MSSNPATVRRTALAAPALLLLHGILRLADGPDGHPGSGPLRDVGHLAFFAGMVLFGLLAVALPGMVPVTARRLATVATVAAVIGVACFLWGIAGDLSTGFRSAAPLPAALQTAGPMLFALGVLILFGLLVAARRLPARTPLLFGAGVAAITVEPDLLPIAALVLLAALAPLRRTGRPVVLRPVLATGRH
ncbi:hypothetical protein [Actinoplanes teichomyceticus]|uniref:Uncharacterized protein n=1 Tax=Actinoplanes teichomyceticus TaxID=1867 RepID=A0A561WKH2_ACTTI|nr:hypothetical protein [Actinoplanes teichomyceticus]TWG24369.1 hypothetical protein FHX34_102925 [Actinoplanes teichomyceticus]GIF12779.1 hypothetical protein Ate01nite_28110 [Actinoplanes teichomyceticus]